MDIIKQQGLTIQEFTELRIKDVQLLTPDEVKVLKDIRERIPMPTPDTPMQKIIHAGKIERYLKGEFKAVGGFISKADDVSRFKTYDDIVDNLRLDYKSEDGSTPFVNDPNDHLGQIRFKTTKAETIEIPYGNNRIGDAEPFGGTEHTDKPFTGNGFAGALNHNVIPEYKVPEGQLLPVNDGAELYKIYRDGREELVAIYSENDKRFVEVK